MGLSFVILANEADRPLKVPLLVIGAGLVLIGLAWVVHRIWLHFYLRKARKRQLEEWTALAQARGFKVDARGDELVMRGTVATRSFELDSGNFFGYGVDSENALRFRVEDVHARFSILGGDGGEAMGDLQPAVGDEDFDKRYRVRANEPGLRWIRRFGPKERRLLVEFPGFDVDQMGGQVRIRMPYRLDLAHLDAACRLVESAWGPPPEGKSLSESVPAD